MSVIGICAFVLKGMTYGEDDDTYDGALEAWRALLLLLVLKKGRRSRFAQLNSDAEGEEM